MKLTEIITVIIAVLALIIGAFNTYKSEFFEDNSIRFNRGGSGVGSSNDQERNLSNWYINAFLMNSGNQVSAITSILVYKGDNESCINKVFMPIFYEESGIILKPSDIVRVKMTKNTPNYPDDKFEHGLYCIAFHYFSNDGKKIRRFLPFFSYSGGMKLEFAFGEEGILLQ